MAEEAEAGGDGGPPSDRDPTCQLCQHLRCQVGGAAVERVPTSGYPHGVAPCCIGVMCLRIPGAWHRGLNVDLIGLAKLEGCQNQFKVCQGQKGCVLR